MKQTNHLTLKEFSDYHIIPSEVGNRPQGNWNENPIDETDKEF